MPRLDLFIVDIRQLRYFVGVVEAGSFTKAAATLNVAQSALSLHVRQLEEGFGTQLLVRDRTGVSVTASGDKLLERARIILKEILLTEAELTNSVAAPSGEVTIGIPSGAARVLSGPLLESVRSELPRISLKMIEGMTGPLEEVDGFWPLQSGCPLPHCRECGANDSAGTRRVLPGGAAR